MMHRPTQLQSDTSRRKADLHRSKIASEMPQFANMRWGGGFFFGIYGAYVVFTLNAFLALILSLAILTYIITTFIH